MSRFDLTRDEVNALVAGQPSYRAAQVWRAMWTGAAPEAMTNLPKSLRQELAATPGFAPALRAARVLTGDGGNTVKWLWELDGGNLVEAVLMHYRDRSTVCVSTQAGCAMGCTFCATGQAGFGRNLSAGEIVEQVVVARAMASESGHRLSNVVFMGMGEPLANYERMWRAVELIHSEIALSARHITVSTVGVIPGIKRLAAEPLPVNLAVSLHAANDDLRNTLVPLNRRYPLQELVAACREYLNAKSRRLSFEWALIDGVNDRRQDAVELATIASGLRAHVNLIPLNPTPYYATRGTPPAGVRFFRDVLVELGVNATIRRTRGQDISAACGQLAGTSQPVPIALTH